METERYWNKNQRDHPRSLIGIVCRQCGKKQVIKKWYYNTLTKRNKGRGPFCSRECALTGRPCSESTKEKISLLQKGVSVLTRGRPGHPVSEEAKQKIRKAKLGVPCVQDYDIVLREMENRGVTKYANLTRRPIPDAVYFNDGKMIAVEVEKEKWETGIRRKMQEYMGHESKWDKVILVWHTPDNIKQKEWTLENGKWRRTF